METKMSLEQVLQITINILNDIQIPVGLLDQVGVPIRNAASNLNECILAIKREKESNPPEETADDENIVAEVFGNE